MGSAQLGRCGRPGDQPLGALPVPQAPERQGIGFPLLSEGGFPDRDAG